MIHRDSVPEMSVINNITPIDPSCLEELFPNSLLVLTPYQGT
jgi:hypothetical protein